MKLTKDEAMILGAALEEYKWGVCQRMEMSKERSLQIMHTLNNLQFKLEDYSCDERLNREKTVRSFQDRIRRYVFGVFDSWDIDRPKRKYNRKTLLNSQQL